MATDGLSAGDAAEHAGYSPYHFNRLFSATMRVSPGRYLTAIRIDAAKRRLLATTDPVIDVAAAVGFDSLSSFSRRFRVMVGTSPGAFRALADTVAEHSIQPFQLGDPRQSTVLVRPRLPAELRPGPAVALWIGWFPGPIPIRLPAAGVLATSDDEIALPLSPGNPWLLSFAVSAHAEANDQLVPERPLIARCALPIIAPATVELTYRYASGVELPLLPALPSLIR
ncbi:MAG TPA: helix-turn-helix transcriptional regulator [Mycobacterium sp.]|nr:helix-turn-helix transcriptional regulator [Mycobacterium sp.]